MNRHGGVEVPALDRPKSLGLADRLLVIGLGVSMISFIVFPRTLSGLATIVEPWSPGRSTSPVASVPGTTPHSWPVNQGAPVTIGKDPLRAFPASPASRLVGPDARLGLGDARLYLRDAAAAAHRLAGAGPRQGETRTDLWINAPESIGSTSPPDANPVNPSVKE
jgi:hypothetical protein